MAAVESTYAESEVHHRARSVVSLGAILAGAAGAAALSYILVILGFGLGFSAVSPWSNAGASAKAFGLATAAWLAFTQIAASGMGGYLAGRLRVAWTGVHTDEVYFRDTAHGFLSWAVASLVVAAFLASSIASIVSGTASTVGAVASAATSAAGAAAGGVADKASDSASYYVDQIFRADPNSTTAVANVGDDTRNRAEAARIFVNDLAAGALAPSDKQYLGQVVAKATGLSQADAEARVDTTFSTMRQTLDTATAKTKEAADAARKAAAIASLWLFVSLLSGAFFASLFATWGGRARDAIVVAALPARV